MNNIVSIITVFMVTFFVAFGYLTVSETDVSPAQADVATAEPTEDAH